VIGWGARVDAQQTRVRVRMVVRRGAVHPVVPIQHVRVQPGVHAFARAPRAERPPTPQHHVEHAHRDEVGVLMRASLEADHDVRQHRKPCRCELGDVALLLPTQFRLRPPTTRDTHLDQSPGVLRHAVVHRDVLVGRKQSPVALPDGFFVDEVLLHGVAQFVVVDPHSGHHHAFGGVVLAQVREQELPVDLVDVLLGAQFWQAQSVVPVGGLKR
jgi:hypothetical protein